MVATFDYKGFAKNLTKQAENVLPEDIATEHKKEFLDRIYNFTFIAGEAFSNDETIENSDTAKALTQVISEWTFHKYVDLLRSDIPRLFHESILQKIVQERAFENDYRAVTEKILLEKVSYEEALQALIRIIESKMFVFHEM